MPTFYAQITTLDVPSGPPGWDTFPKPMPQPPLGIWGGPWQPPYPSQGPGFPTHPIAPGGPPLGIWGGGNVPYPTPPMAPGGPPLGTWGGGNVPYPTPPIYFPGEPVDPGYHPPGVGGPGSGLGTWGGGNVPYPTPPIVIPPDMPPTMPDPDSRPIEWKTGWTEKTGWIVVGIPQGRRRRHRRAWEELL
jgi:hypothetical protein